LLDNCFAFVANWQMFSAVDSFGNISSDHVPEDVGELYHFIKENADIAMHLEEELTSLVKAG